MTLQSRWWAWLVAGLTLCSLVATLSWVRPTGDVAELLPSTGDASAFLLRERLFGSREPGLLLVEGDDAAEVARAAATFAGHVPRAITGLDAPADAPATAWMLVADDHTHDAIARALSADGMAARLHETRALLLAPGGSALASRLTSDPLRIAELVGASASDGPKLRSDDGKARMVVVPSDAKVLTSSEASAAYDALVAATNVARAAHPTVALHLAGAHAVAAETERRIRTDVVWSSLLSLALSALVFLAVSRNARLLVTVLPPVLAGTLMTAALVPLAGGRLSGIAAAFVSVVVGVGMDTGVHAHLAVVDAVRARDGDPVARALSVVARPTLTAALAAGAAFACLSVSSIPALRQLGYLAAAGEVLTALAVLAWTPRLALWTERGRVVDPVVGPVPSMRVTRALLLLGSGAMVVLAAIGVRPRLDGPVVALKTDTLEVSRTYARLSDKLDFPRTAPEVVLLRGPDEASLAARVEALSSALRAQGIGSAIPLTNPLLAHRQRRRATLDLATKANELEVALRAAGFDPSRFAAAMSDLRAPSASPPALGIAVDEGWGRDGDAFVAQLRVDRPDARLRSVVLATEPTAAFAGVGAIERSLRAALSHDLLRLLPLCALVVLASLSLALRNRRVVGVAVAAALVSLALTWTTLGALRVPLHVFDALVLPVLFGLTLDETLFLYEARSTGHMARELPRVATTALTTAAGFGALLVCEFPGLRDVGWTGMVGSLAGLVGSVLVVSALPQPTSAP